MQQGDIHLFQIFESDPALTGVFTILVKVLDEKAELINTDMTFEVTIKCTKSITLLTESILDIYRLMEIDPPQTHSFDMPTYDVYPTYCLKQDFQLSIEYVGVPSGTPFPEFLSYD